MLTNSSVVTKLLYDTRIKKYKKQKYLLVWLDTKQEKLPFLSKIFFCLEYLPLFQQFIRYFTTVIIEKGKELTGAKSSNRSTDSSCFCQGY